MNKHSPGHQKSTQVNTLSAYAQALNRETHVLQDHPDLLWQQMYNRLQWADGEQRDGPVSKVIAPAFETRTSPGTKPWFRNKRRIRESESLIRILGGHTGPVNSCAFSPDSRLLAFASEDRTVRLWDAHTGEIVAILPCLGIVYNCEFNTQGSRLAAGDMGGNVYLLGWVGTETNPIIMTAIQKMQQLVNHCPLCQQDYKVSKDQLGCEISCPTPGCGLKLKLNLFVINKPKEF